MARDNWTEEQITIVLYEYCRNPFGQFLSTKIFVKELGQLIGRSHAAIVRKVGNLASFDPLMKARGVGGLGHTAKLDEMIWNKYYGHRNQLAYDAEILIAKLRGYLRLNRNVKRPFVIRMKELCNQIGMRFYVSDAHFKEECHNGSCCGLPQSWNYSRGQFCNALMIAKEKGFVKFSDIKQDIEDLLCFERNKATGFNTNSSEERAKFLGMSMSDYMRWLWNNPQAGQSPYKLFEGVLVPNGEDEEGNLIYFYDVRRTLTH